MDLITLFYGRIVEEFLSFGLGKPLSSQSLVNYFGNLEDTVERNANSEVVACEVSKGSKDCRS